MAGFKRITRPLDSVGETWAQAAVACVSSAPPSAEFVRRVLGDDPPSLRWSNIVIMIRSGECSLHCRRASKQTCDNAGLRAYFFVVDIFN